MTLHLSRLHLSARSSRTAAELRDPYQLHRSIAKAFAPSGSEPEAGKGALDAARFLFRVEPPTRAGAPVMVLVQSRVRPDWHSLTGVAGYLEQAPETVELPASFPEGSILAFRLRATPTVKRDGKRRGLFTENERSAWLGRKARDGGFSLLQVSVADERAVRASTRAGPGKGEFSACRFDGILRVADPEAFAATIAGGVGAAKGYGFGLLSVAPVRD